MSKRKTVSQRAQAYTRHTSANDAYDASRSSSAWSAGYRAAMKDVRKELSGRVSCEGKLHDVYKLVNDFARLK